MSILIKNATKKGFLEAAEGDGIDISGRMNHHRGTVQKDLSQTITRMGGADVGTLQDLQIRKLSPLECVRLMGFTDEDYQAMRDIGMSDNAIYHMAGDSIVVTVLMSIFSTLLFDDDRHKQIVKDYIKGGIIEER